MVYGKQYIVRGRPKCNDSSVQLFQLKKPTHHREEAGTGVASSSMPQSQDPLIDPSPQCLPLHTALNLSEIVISIMNVQYFLITLPFCPIAQTGVRGAVED